MDRLLEHNIGSLVNVVRAAAAASLTAAGTGDATTTTGATIDRVTAAGGLARSALFSTVYDATLTSSKTLSITQIIQDSADGTNFSDYQTAAAATVVATGTTGGSTAAGQLNLQVDLGSARRYVRINTVPDLSHTGTDTALTRSVAVLGGFDRLPAPN